MTYKEEAKHYKDVEDRSMGIRKEPDPTKFLCAEIGEFLTFNSQFNQAYIELPDGRGLKYDTLIRGLEFREFIDHRHFEIYNRPISPTVLRRVIQRAETSAHCASHRLKIDYRLGLDGDWVDGSLTRPHVFRLDLANRFHDKLEIQAGGTQRASDPFSRFRQSPDMCALPEPKEPPASRKPIRELRTLFRLNKAPERNFRRCLIFLLSAFIHQGPRPVLLLRGPEQSGKSTLARMLRSLLDPVAAPFTNPTTSQRKLGKLAARNRILAFDDIGRTHAGFQQALRKLSSGITYEVPASGDETGPVTTEYARPVILTQDSSEPVPRRLLSRALIVELPELEPEDRIPTDDLLKEFDELRPYFLYEFCRALETLLGRYNTLHLPASERYAELARWSLAAAPALDLTEADILEALRHDPCPATQAVIDFMKGRETWTGSITDLADELEDPFPTSNNHITRWLRDSKQELAKANLKLETKRHKNRRQISLTRLANHDKNASQSRLIRKKMNDFEKIVKFLSGPSPSTKNPPEDPVPPEKEPVESAPEATETQTNPAEEPKDPPKSPKAA